MALIQPILSKHRATMAARVLNLWRLPYSRIAERLVVDKEASAFPDKLRFDGLNIIAV